MAARSANQSDRAAIFTTSFCAIAATSFCFVLRALVIDRWGVEFSLSATQKGELLGVGLWPFAITIVLLSLLIDRIGFRAALWFAAACHATGLALLLAASGYWTLYLGTFVMALGNGAVEAAANPVIATVFAEDKPRWLNRLHAAWPGGMIVGGVLALLMGEAVGWRFKVALMALPIAAYALLLLRTRFPASERVAAGVPYRAMLEEAGYLSALVIVALMMLEVGRVAAWPAGVTIAIVAVLTAGYAFYARSMGRPLYVIFVLLMIPLATTELSTDGWISSLMEPEMAGIGLQAGWVLIYTSAIVFVIRLFAGTVVRALNPLGTLALASGLAALGLGLLAGATGPTLILAATLYGIGKSFFWGTSLALGSEQFPRGGAVTINVMAGAGMLAAGIVGSVLLGAFQDGAVERGLANHDAATGSAFVRTYLTETKRSVLGTYRAVSGESLARAPAADRRAVEDLTDRSKKSALREVALLPVMMLAVYLSLLIFFRRRGGYRPVRIATAGAQGR